MSGTVRLERNGRTATLTVDRPPLNILDLATLGRLDEVLAELASDAELQVLVVRGAGERAFSAGVAVEDHVGDRIAPMLGAFHRALRRLRDLPAVSIASVRGHCLGGGMELALACDLVVAATGSRFGLPEIQLGCYPPFAAALLPARLGRQKALELMLTGRIATAEEAERLGLVTNVVAADELGAATDRLAAAIAAHSGPVVRLTKRAAAAGEAQPFAGALEEAERLYLDELTATEDMHEGIRAFLEKRRPVWRHR